MTLAVRAAEGDREPCEQLPAQQVTDLPARTAGAGLGTGTWHEHQHRGGAE
jgi:hypothetical protein